jgi:IS30 family transposase
MSKIVNIIQRRLFIMPKTRFSNNSGKHLTIDERKEIEFGLNSGYSIRKIADFLHKSPSTISREINRYTKHFEPTTNCCEHRNICNQKHMCRKPTCSSNCSVCRECVELCSDYIEEPCTKKENTPLKLCNGCSSFNFCRKRRAKYDGIDANKKYRDSLVNTRKGFDISDEEIQRIDELVTPLVKNGNSPYAIKQELGDELTISEATLRRLIDSQQLTARRIDLRDAVRRKPRKKARTMNNEIVMPSKEGHKYTDFLNYLRDNFDSLIVQMDCVEGLKTDSKTLLTLHFPLYHFQLIFLMPAHTSRCVVDVLDKLERALGTEMFRRIFGLILTDNGHEFTDIAGMERSVFGGKRTHIYFCDPNRSDQKAQCETNHKLIRYILPKKTSFEFLSQEKVTLMTNHINSYPRASLMGVSPYKTVKGVFPAKFLESLGIRMIPARSLNLTPSLLKK